MTIVEKQIWKSLNILNWGEQYVGNQELDIDNIISYRGKIKQTEIENVGKEMESYIQNKGAKRKGNPTRLQDACGRLNRYIAEHNLQPITVGYNVTRRRIC